jgi:uncharacterized protein (DUF1330 family)
LLDGAGGDECEAALDSTRCRPDRHIAQHVDKEEGVMAAYLVVEVTGVSDESGLGEYATQVPHLVERYGGRYIARGPAQVIEGEHRPGMLVLLEFPSLEQIQAMYDSEEYAPLKALRQRSSAMNFLAVEGL